EEAGLTAAAGGDVFIEPVARGLDHDGEGAGRGNGGVVLVGLVGGNRGVGPARRAEVEPGERGRDLAGPGERDGEAVMAAAVGGGRTTAVVGVEQDAADGRRTGGGDDAGDGRRRHLGSDIVLV